MLRKDAIYITKLHWEPKIPSSEEMKRQVKSKNVSCDNSVRINLCKLVVGKIKES